MKLSISLIFLEAQLNDVKQTRTKRAFCSLITENNTTFYEHLYQHPNILNSFPITSQKVDWSLNSPVCKKWIKT